MKLSIASLIAAGVAPTQARIFAEPLAAACARFDITTPARIGAFLGQCMLESQRFTHLEEDLYYRRAERILEIFGDRVGSLARAAELVAHPEELANQVYAGVNGNTQPGDGFAFHGRGIGQLTGRSNYADAQIGLGRPYVERPNLVALPEDGCLTFAWYWHNHKLNLLADSWQIDAITRAVNGRRMLAADLRRQYSEQAQKAVS